MTPDTALSAWIRFYAIILSVCPILGLGGGLIYINLREVPYEASTIVVQSGRTIVPRQLGSVARSLFQSSTVFGPVVRDLGAETEIDEFLRERTELVPIPEAPSLVILGRSSSVPEAEQISLGMAEQLVEALNRQVGAQEFRVFSGPEPSRLTGELGPTLILFSGTLGGLWTGVAASLIHYRWRRPVLTLRQALALSGAGHLAILDDEKPRRWWRWLTRPRTRRKMATRDDVRLAWLERSIADRPVQFQALESRAEAKRLRRHLDSTSLAGGDGGHSGSQDMLVMVASAGTAEDAIVASRLAAGSTEDARQDRIALVWLR